jgi:hypothetical protein
MPNTPNPYEVLRIPILASKDEIVICGTRLIEAESGEKRRMQYRAAVEALTTHPQELVYHKFWEPAGASYRDADEEAFLARFVAEPVDREALNRRARTFLTEDCAAERLLDALMSGPEPPREIKDCHPGSTPQTPLQVAVEPGELFR